MGKSGEKKDKKNKFKSTKKHKDKNHHKAGKSSDKKKSKSSSDQAVRASANLLGDRQNLSLKIDYVGEQHEAIPVAVFPNGTPVCYMDTSDDQSLLNFQLGSCADSFGVSKEILTAETPRIHYTSGPGQERCRYYVGVSTDDATLQLYDASMFAMTPRVKAAEAMATTERSLVSRGDIQAAQEQLTESFGGKKQQQKVNARERYRVDTDSISQKNSSETGSLLRKHAYNNEGVCAWVSD